MKPKKSLSQNYLNDPNIGRKITTSFLHQDPPRVIEIGPGYGMLTRFLYEQHGAKLYMVEIDAASVADLQKKFPGIAMQIIQADIISFPLEDLLIPGTVLAGNLPYHITSPILFRILDHVDKIDESVFMIQKEVAERITARPGSKDWGLLSVLLQTYYDCSYLFTVSEKVFFPQPRVKSAVIRLVRNDRKELPCNTVFYREMLKKIFGQRRKMIRNSLGDLRRHVVKNTSFLTRRPEQMSVQDFIALCSELSGV